MLVVTVEGSSPSRPAEPASTTPLTTHLVVVEDDDDIDWNVYNFENSESAEELIALIQVAGPPRRIEGPVLRILRHLHHITSTHRIAIIISSTVIRDNLLVQILL